MSKALENLQELQALGITLTESRILHLDENHPDIVALKERIAELRSDVPADHLARFDRLSRQGLAVVTIRGGLCQGCYISIPQGDINRIVSGKLEPICPHCGKFVRVES